MTTFQFKTFGSTSPTKTTRYAIVYKVDGGPERFDHYFVSYAPARDRAEELAERLRGEGCKEIRIYIRSTVTGKDYCAQREAPVTFLDETHVAPCSYGLCDNPICQRAARLAWAREQSGKL